MKSIYNNITAPLPFGMMLPLLVCCYLLSGLLLFIYYRKFHPWKEVINARVQFCCFPSTPISLMPGGVCSWDVSRPSSRQSSVSSANGVIVLESTTSPCDANTEDENIADNNIEMGEVHPVTARPLDDTANQDVVWRHN